MDNPRAEDGYIAMSVEVTNGIDIGLAGREFYTEAMKNGTIVRYMVPIFIASV